MQQQEQFQEVIDEGAADEQQYGGNAELQKLELLEQYQQRCQVMEVAPNRCFVRYLEETQDENDSLELVV